MANAMDVEFKPVDINAEFGKARRNILFWSTLTIAASVANVQNESLKLSMSGLSGLSFRYDFVLISLIIITIFHLFGFMRDLSVVSRNNKPIKLSDMKSLVKDIQSRHENITQSIVNFNSKIEQYQDQLSNEYYNIKNDIKSVFEEKFKTINECLSKFYRSGSDLEKVAIINDNLRREDFSESIVDDVLKKFDVSVRGYVEVNSVNATNDLNINLSELHVSIKKLSEIPDFVNKISEDIDSSSRNWHNYYDVKVVWIAFAFAMLAASGKIASLHWPNFNIVELYCGCFVRKGV